MKILLLITLFTLISCGMQKESKGLNIHPEAQPYITSFENFYQRNISNLEVSFKDFDSSSNILGYCQTGTGRPRIVINNFYWNSPQFTFAEKEQLMYHELGHCVLNRGHKGNATSDSNVVSIMNSYGFSGYFYTKNYSALIGELFGYNQSYADLSFNDTTYIASTFPDYIDNDFEILSEHDLHDCVGEKHDLIGEEESHNHDEE